MSEDRLREARGMRTLEELKLRIEEIVAAHMHFDAARVEWRADIPAMSEDVAALVRAELADSWWAFTHDARGNSENILSRIEAKLDAAKVERQRQRAEDYYRRHG